MQSKLGHLAIFFYNEMAPEVIAMLWRPDAFTSQPFSAVKSEFLRPIESNWQENSLVIANATDTMNAVQNILKILLLT